VVAGLAGQAQRCGILDGGLKAWHAAHLPLSLDPPVKREGTFSGEPDMKLLIDAEHLGKRLGSLT
jgi:thiosulfate/3-mercaptopyruvate sulfurtransferase